MELKHRIVIDIRWKRKLGPRLGSPLLLLLLL